MMAMTVQSAVTNAESTINSQLSDEKAQAFILSSQVKSFHLETSTNFNKAGYTATPVACGWAGAVIEVNASFGQEQ